MWFVTVTIFITTILLFYFLSLQKKYKWDGIFIYVSCSLPYLLPLFYMMIYMLYLLLSLSLHLIVLAQLIILFLTYWLAWKKAKETILIFGIHRKNCAEYLSRLIQNFGFSNPDISPLERSWTDIKFFDGTRPAYKVTSQDSSYYFRIQFGYFTRIDICETQNEKDERKFEIDETKVKSFKETCWKTFDELSDNTLIAPYITGLLSLLVFAIIPVLINSIGIFYYFVGTSYSIFLILPQFALSYCMLIPYKIDISEFLPDLDERT